MKWFRHIVNGMIWAVVGLYVAFFVLLHIPSVQQGIGTAAANAIGEKLGTKVAIGQINVGLFHRVVIDDATILDQNGKRMLQAARLSVRIKLLPLLQGRIAIASAQAFGTHISLYKASATAKPNYQFVLDSLASKDTEKKQGAIDFTMGSFIMRRSSISYDRLDVAPKRGVADMDHLRLSDISANIQVNMLTNDSVNLRVRKLAFNERSGFSLSRLSLVFEAGKNNCRLSDLELATPNSHISIPIATATYHMKDGMPDWSKAAFRAQLGKSAVASADVAKFVAQAANVNSTAIISANIFGQDGKRAVAPLNITTSGGATLKANASVAWTGNGKRAWHADIQRLFIPTTAWTEVGGVLSEKTNGVLAVLKRLGNITASGSAGTQGDDRTEASANIATDIGSADLGFAIGRDNSFKALVKTDNTALNRLIDNTHFGMVQAEVEADGTLAKGALTTVHAKANVGHFTYNGYEYKNIGFDGNYSADAIDGQLTMDDANGHLNVSGSMNKRAGTTSVNLKGFIADLAPKALGLTSKWGNARFSAAINGNVKGSTIADATGSVAISDFKMEKADDTYELNQLTLSSGLRGTQRYLALRGDFGHAEMVGNVNFTTVTQSIADFARRVLPTLPLLPQHTKHANNDFLLNAEITKTDWLQNIVQVPLTANGTISVNGKVSDTDKLLYLNCTAPAIDYAGQEFENVAVAITSPRNTLHANVKATKRLGDGDRLLMELTGNAHDNCLETSLVWNNDDSNDFKGQLNADAHFGSGNGANGTEVNIRQSSITIGYAEWTVKPARMTIGKKRLGVEDFAITHGGQHIIVNGTASASTSDSLLIDLNGIDVAYVLNLVNFHSVDFAGLASGRACITNPFGRLDAEARLSVKNFTFEDGRMGTLHANVEWNENEKQIDIDATANDGADAMTLINGYVSPSRNYIDLDIKALGTHIDFARSFTSSFMDRLDGHANGAVRLHGALNALNLTGELVVDGQANISTTGCTYNMLSDTLRFKIDEIEFANAHITDTYGNSGWINGGLHHNNLKRLSYDIGIESDGMLVYDIRSFGDNTFYGTVFGSGDIDIHGGRGEVTMDMEVTPQANSSFVYNASNPDGISKQEFIRWNDRTATAATDLTLGNKRGDKASSDNGNRKQTSDMRINFALNMNPNATIKLLMDSKTNDYITLNGSGTLRATYYNKGVFNIYGTYTVTYGTYGVTIQNIIKKNFTFNDGGTIVFRGNPYDAELSLQAVHTVSGVSLSDLNIGNSFSSNTIKVNCLMNIGGQPNKPVVDFDMDMPTVSSDEVQMIRSVINSEDEMNQQVLYLLGIGRFYPQGNNNSTAQNERQQSQTSLAMQSLLSGTLSSQLNSVLNTVIKSNNWKFGANISTGDEGWNNAEYEGLLSGRLLNNRLLINGQFGYRDNANTANTSFIGDFDIRYLLTPNGNVAIKVYNQTNDRYFTKSSLNTQGIGLILKKDFGNIGELFKKESKDKKRKK